MSVLSVALVLAAIALVAFVRKVFGRKNLANLRGPEATSRVFGNEYQIWHQKEVGALDFQWMRQYGSTWRIHTYFGVEEVMTVDPKAMQHILHKSGYNYPKRVEVSHFTALTVGSGILSAEGETHHRHRKVMNPAFSAQQLKEFLPLFQRTIGKVVEKWKAEINGESDAVIRVDRWLARSALDIVGEASFDYRFNALDDVNSPLAREYSTVFKDTGLYPSSGTLLWRATWPYLPTALLNLTKYTPTALYSRLRRLNAMFEDMGRPLYKASAEDWDGSREEKRDVMSVLIKANTSETARTRLSEGEVLAQMHNLTAAGHETTSSTLTWMLYELSKLPAYQARMREEIREARARVISRGDGVFTMDDLDGMKVVLAAIKETLRFHPIAYHLQRFAAKDDIIPLSDPVIGKDGEVITELPVSAGQPILLSICGYNRLPQVWGEDADTWNPERFLGSESEKQVKVGVYANLLTFSAGLRACIGWRFALYQLQAVSAELLEKFEFALPEDTLRVSRAPGGVMVPSVQDKKGGEVLAMPLRVSLAQ